MKIIFYSYSGVHSALLAGAAYLGRLSDQKAASIQFSEVPFFGYKENKSQLRYLGEDKKGNQIFSLGVQGEIELIPKSIKSFLEILDISSNEMVMINTYSNLSILSRWGEKLARGGLTILGNHLFCLGLKKDFPILLKEVHNKLVDS